MSKQSEYFRGRNEGLQLARKIVSEGGIEELDRKIEYVGATGVELGVTQKELDKASAAIRKNCTITAIAISVYVLISDRFCFSNYQLKQFQQTFNEEINHCVEDPNRLAWLFAQCQLHGIEVRVDDEED